MRWSRTERAQDPSLLFWARATRANRLCKEGEHALALKARGGPYRPYDWAPHRYDDDDDDDDDDGHSDDDDDDDDDDAEFDRARRAWGSSRDQSDSWSEYFRQKRA
ncbi:hypothetical protein JL720_12521 [Aureococcus anophagefferens]|nr:hypothetical protein JL720_12521 [Aureococcus anophagefferens]